MMLMFSEVEVEVEVLEQTVGSSRSRGVFKVSPDLIFFTYRSSGFQSNLGGDTYAIMILSLVWDFFF